MKADVTHVSGSCLCGQIRYEADVFLKNGYICRCTICQKSSGHFIVRLPRWAGL